MYVVGVLVFFEELSTQNTPGPLARHYQQQFTVEQSKPDCSEGRNQEEALEVDRTLIEDSTQLHHKASPQLESSRQKKKGRPKNIL